MKNLNVVLRKQLDFQSSVAYCIDQDNGTLFVLTEDLRMHTTQLYSESILIEANDADAISKLIGATSISREDILLFEFVVEVGSILIALKHGHLILVPASCLTAGECIYKHERRISSISLTPSQDIIALADEDHNIQVMSSFDCIVLHTSNALTESESLFKPVGVGWGSKETQFFGLDGRPSQEKRVDTIQLSEKDLALSDDIEASEIFVHHQQCQKRSTIIDWRGDGQLVATLTYLPETNKHSLKVWNRNLELQYMSEQLVTVERGLLCWIPDGKFVCCAQRRDRRINEIALFEKNGLVRQRISLPTLLPDLYVSTMAWSPNSKILAIISKQFVIHDEQVQQKHILMMYTMQNWHYYLKFSIKLPDDSDYALKWDASNMNRLHLMSNKGLYKMYDCNILVDHSWNHSSVAVVDSNKILITPFELCILPPPMSALTIEMSSLIYRVAYDWHSSNHLLALTSDDHLVVAGSNFKQDPSYEPLNFELKVTVNHGLDDSDLNDMKLGLENYVIYKLTEANSYQNLTSLGGRFLGVASKSYEYGSEVMLLDVDRKTLKLVVKLLRRFEFRQIINIQPTFDYDNLIIALDDSSFFIQDLCHLDKVAALEFKPTISESKFSYNYLEIRVNYSSKPSVITLGHDSCLRLNEKVIAFNSCSSFYCSGSYIIYTTTDNHMHFVLLENLESNQSEVDSWSQPIEPGATIVCAIERLSKVILQMPRGNLETLHPRILVLKKIIELLKRNDFIDACRFARRHRVNMNFLIDYLLRIMKSPKILSEFALAIASSDPNLLCLVLTELDNNDTIADRYSDVIKHISGHNSIDRGHPRIDKVNFVCEHIKLPENKEFLSPRLQCFLKMEPKQTGEALKIVHQLDGKAQVEAIKFLLYFVDIDQLFNDALSTYNTDITLMVAGCSNKDPKQYLAFLDDLNHIQDENLRCYKIDIFVKHYELAFEHLFAHLSKGSCDKKKIQEQLIEMVTSKRIYKSAIALLVAKGNLEPDLTETIWTKYASYLMDKRYFNEAGLAFTKALAIKNNQRYFDLALACYAFVEDWERSLALIARSQVTDSRKVEALERISAQLVARGKYAEAVLASQYCKLSNGRLADLIQRGSWYLAEFLAFSAADERIVDSTRSSVANSVLNAARQQYDTWSDENSIAKNQFERLKLLLTSSRIDPAKNRFERGGFISDSLSTVDGSEMSSILSGSENQKVARSGVTSIKTRSSSKSAKPHQKRIKLQEGSRYEDRAIVLELKKFMTKQKTNHEDAIRLSAAMFEYCPYEEAAAQTTNLNKLLTECLTFSQSVSELLWPQSAHMDQTYSLYTKMGSSLSLGDEATSMIENVDLEVLMKPTLAANLHLFEI